MQGTAPAFGVVADVFSSHRVLASAATAALAVAAFGASAQQPATAQNAPTAQGDTRVIGTIRKKIPACQSLKEPECNANPDCMFVPEGRRKDGMPIPAYCRAKPPPR
jgi:hypothetical protein